MRPGRSPAPFVFPVALLLAIGLAACGSSGRDGAPGDNGAAPTAPADDGEPRDGGGGGQDAADAEAFADSLVPPNATERSRSTAGGLVVVSYTSTVSLDSIIEHYDRAIPDAGLNVASRITVDDGASWTVGSGTFSGSITVEDDRDGGTNVIISALDMSQ